MKFLRIIVVCFFPFYWLDLFSVEWKVVALLPLSSNPSHHLQRSAPSWKQHLYPQLRHDHQQKHPKQGNALDLVSPKSKYITCSRYNSALYQSRFLSDESTILTTTSTSKAKTSSSRPSRTKKTVQDRTPQEMLSLIQDILAAVVDAGPQAGPIRTLEAYRAITLTVQDFILTSGFFPSKSSPMVSKSSQPVSAPIALRKLFERLGATYIKLGQFIASSPTLFPREYVTEFQKCLDQTEPLEWSIIKRVIEQELGPISRSFSYVDTKPLASASIAQVHRASLKNTGEEVVIKVQKPSIDASLRADLSFIYVASRILEFFQPDWERTSLSAVAADIRSSMLLELDFLQEASNLQEFRDFLQEQQLTSIATAPRVISQLTTSKVLTMQYLKGVSLLDTQAISKISSKDPESIIVNALNVWTTSVQTMPFFHADVHAGNLLVLQDGRVGFLDFGIVGRVSPSTFAAVSELSLALAQRNYRGMAQALCNMGATNQDVDIDKFAMDIENLLTNMSRMQPNFILDTTMASNPSTSAVMNEEEVTNVLLDIVKVTEDNGLKLPREFGLLVKQSLYFDRYLKILAPELASAQRQPFDEQYLTNQTK